MITCAINEFAVRDIFVDMLTTHTVFAIFFSSNPTHILFVFNLNRRGLRGEH